MTIRQLKLVSIAASLSGILVVAGCHKKVVAKAPVPPPPSPAPTATITAEPEVVQQGQSTSLTWKTANATNITISGLGTVAADGTRKVTLNSSTTYTLTAKGPGGSTDATVRVTVNPVPPATASNALTDEQLFAQNVHDIFFDYDKYKVRSGDESTVQQDAVFLSKHPNMKIAIDGHCDDRGSEEYNLALGESRAQAMQKALVANGISTVRIKTKSYGKENPFCTEDNEQCWQQNRRDHLKLDE